MYVLAHNEFLAKLGKHTNSSHGAKHLNELTQELLFFCFIWPVWSCKKLSAISLFFLSLPHDLFMKWPAIVLNWLH